MSISQLLRKYKDTGVYIGPTLGLSSPKNDRRACLCLDKNTYSRSCCDGLLIQQGIGSITSTRIQPAVALGGFSAGFSSGFQITS
jgi:hypothetical protein